MEENTALTEVITIYERMKKGRAAAAIAKIEPVQLYRLSNFGITSTVKLRNNKLVEEPIMETVPNFGVGPQQDEECLLPAITVTEPKPLGEKNQGSLPSSIPPVSFLSVERERLNSNSSRGSRDDDEKSKLQLDELCPKPIPKNYVLNFNKYKYFEPKKYTYFSGKTNLLQSDTLEGLRNGGAHSQLLSSKYYWLDILQPSTADLHLLSKSFNVHDLTIADILAQSQSYCGGGGGGEEKIELFKNYTYVSIKLMSEQNLKERALDLTFNVLIFKDFVITTHESAWISIRDILGFINIITDYTETTLTPDWILFSIFIELAQDAQYLVDKLEPEINRLRIESDNEADCTIGEMSDVMKRILSMEFQIYQILQFLKPKINILRILRSKCEKRVTKVITKRLTDVRDDFQQITSDLTTLDNILQRSQRTFLALVDVQKSVEANEMSKIMKRISEVALVFLPIQSIAGFNGMNVRIPFQHVDSTWPFWLIVSSTVLLSALFYFLRKIMFVDGATVGKTSLLFWKKH